ncbi:MAG: PAS domain-containing protein [Sphingomonadales bacterium]|jgi:PAS domain S-box-containing protein
MDAVKSSNIDALTKEGAQQLCNLMARAPIAMSAYDRNFTYIAANKSWAFYFDTQPEKLIGRSLDLSRDEMPDHWVQALDRAMAGEFVSSEAERHVKPNGDAIWVRWRCFPWTEDGTKDSPIGGVVVLVEDVSSAVDSREVNDLAEERLRLALEAGHQALWELHPASDTARLLFDFTKHSLPLEHLPTSIEAIVELAHPNERGELRSALDDLVEGQKSSLSKVFRILVAGEERWLHLQCLTVQFRADGKADLIIGIHKDVTEQRLSDEATIKEKERLEFALEGAADGLWDWNLQTGEVYVSPRWLEQLGYKPGEIDVDFDFWVNSIHPDFRQSVVGRAIDRRDGVLEEYRKGMAAPFSYEYRLKCKDGVYRWFLSRGQTVAFDSAGQPLRVVGTHTDISQRKRMEQDLIAARDVAEEANRAKSAFIANMSHEIRTPLSGVMGMLELIKDTPLNEEQGRLLEIAKSSAEALLLVVNDILDLSRLESGHIEQRPREFDLKSLVDDVVSVLQVKSQAKGLHLSHQAGPRTVTPLYGDADRIRQVLFNLVGNAIKFTKEGSVTISTALEANDWGKVVATVSVTDTGVGVPRDAYHYIFERFRQADDSLDREHEGSGLGLAISKEIVELLGGTIGFSSEPGVGSRFWFTVPLDQAAREESVGGEDTVGHDTDVVKRRVLLAEDNQINQLLICSLLEKRGHEVVVAENGVVALERIAEKPFDIILMDVQMPVLDGLSVTKKIRAMGGGMKKVPIIALTAHAMVGQYKRYREAGMTDVISKPVNPDRLFELVEGTTTFHAQQA